jgi:DNA-binding PadR family transcriptional regulator
MVTDLWEARDRPLLEAIARADEEGHAVERVEMLFGTDEIGDGQVIRGLKALYQDGLITGIEASSFSGFELLEIELTGEGRRAIGQWPQGNPYADLLHLLEAEAARSTDPEQRSRLQEVIDAFKRLGEGVAANIIATWIQRQSGI